MKHTSRGRFAAVLSLTLVALFATTAVASAATLTRDGSTLTFEAAPGIDNDLVINQADPAVDTVTIATNDPITALPAGCTDTDDAAAPSSNVSCTGVTAIVTNMNDGQDDVNATGLDTVVLTFNGGDGDDLAEGGGAADTLNGGGDDDDLEGGAGNDVLNGDAGDDFFVGGFGDDIANGGAGDDFFDADSVTFVFDADRSTERDPGNDTYSGGDGIDEVNYDAYGYNSALGENFAIPVTVTLDDQANDGQEGEADNVGSDVEDVDIDGNTEARTGAATITGSGAVNFIESADGPDQITPAGGNDFVEARGGDDTINAVDGFADRIDCGEDGDDLNDDNDTANVDEYDQVASNCETVNLTRLGRFAEEDAQPGISWVTPASDGLTLPTTSATRLAVDVTDDRGIAQVIFLAGNRVLCTDTVAPFECDFTPTGDDVGETTLVAIAVDTAQQTTVALRYVELNRFALNGFLFGVTPKSDQSYPLRFRARGRLILPTAVSREEGCRGKVITRWKVGKKTISTRGVSVNDDCTWSVRNKFGERYRIVASKIRVFAAFQGNDVLRRKKAPRKTVRVLKGGDGG